MGRPLARLARQLDTALTRVGLSAAQYRVLAFLDEEDAAMASRLADRLRVSRPTVTALIDGLVAKGLVERRPATQDRRRVEHLLTPAGLRALGTADDAVAHQLEGLLTNLDAEERATATAGLAAWHEALDRARQARLDQAGAP